MKLLIKQRVFSWVDTYDVFDEHMVPVYDVKAEVFTLGHRIHVYDKATGVEVASIRQKLMTFFPTFYLEMGGVSLGSIQRQFSLLRPSYQLDMNGWTVTGDILSWDYDVLDREGYPVMHISKEPFRWGDTYVLDIPDPGDALICLLIAISIDAANCGSNH